MAYKNAIYIESTGFQYIDTEYVANSNISIEMTIAFTDVSTNNTLFCSRGQSFSENTYSCFLISGSGIRFDYYNSGVGSTGYMPSVGVVTKIKASKNKIHINDELKYEYAESSFIAGGNIWLLASYVRSGTDYGNIGNYAKARLYACKIYDGDDLVRDFIPVLDTDSGKAGLYDNIDGVFYASKDNDFGYRLLYSSVEEIVSSSAYMDSLVDNVKYDDNSYTIYDIPDFVKYKGNEVVYMYANGNSWIGFGTNEEHFKYNSRDAAMYNLRKEEGTLGKYRFFRIRWNGVCKYNAAGEPYRQTFDLLIFDTGDVMFYAVDIPTQYYDGAFAFAGVDYNAPTTDSRYTTFYVQEDGTYNTVYAPIEFAPSYITKYLVRDGSAIYTVTDGVLVEVVGVLNAELFMSSGADDIPDGASLLSLNAPEVLCWTDGVNVPTLTATVQGVPTEEHSIISDDIQVGHSSIYGITSVEAIASEGATFFLSFDGGLWMVYDADSNTWVASDIGMTATELVAIPTDAWSSVINSATYMQLKATIDGVDTVTQVKFNFNNESPI